MSDIILSYYWLCHCFSTKNHTFLLTFCSFSYFDMAERKIEASEKGFFTRVSKMEMSSIADLIWWWMSLNSKLLICLSNLEVEIRNIRNIKILSGNAYLNIYLKWINIYADYVSWILRSLALSPLYHKITHLRNLIPVKCL